MPNAAGSAPNPVNHSRILLGSLGKFWGESSGPSTGHKELSLIAEGLFFFEATPAEQDTGQRQGGWMSMMNGFDEIFVFLLPPPKKFYEVFASSHYEKATTPKPMLF
ncbi:predicted protein [Histoplasma capsulatum G186AR]|uniref:Uncharacterized protein n=1 Tax=Ajellomyces capsulatus (strain G186AR / H82 / ATCC MYA-2454 / RMSCC 2432) TaxID=447093 RepID=C0NNH4_AJECG|nr:uncharacterized protein HCBG_04704 [Histoplasma capsulatum G186AR]EEH06484.1 predicted protein [Histoplasma capsulatum G186AR]